MSETPQDNKEAKADSNPPELSPAERGKAIAVEKKNNPDAETMVTITGLCRETLEEHYGHLIRQVSPNRKTTTKGEAYDIAAGRAKRSA